MLLRALSISFVLAVFASAAYAQTWTPEQQEIWQFEEQQWRMSKEKDLSWVDTMVHPNLSYWETDQPGPQNKASLTRWTRYGSTSTSVLEQELFPISVTITGNVAVVQYSYRIAREDYKQERHITSGRYTDILVKEDDRWLFLAWAGGDYPQE